MLLIILLGCVVLLLLIEGVFKLQLGVGINGVELSGDWLYEIVVLGVNVNVVIICVLCFNVLIKENILMD